MRVKSPFSHRAWFGFVDVVSVVTDVSLSLYCVSPSRSPVRSRPARPRRRAPDLLVRPLHLGVVVVDMLARELKQLLVVGALKHVPARAVDTACHVVPPCEASRAYEAILPSFSVCQ